jgi:hypothetical protein
VSDRHSTPSAATTHRPGVIGHPPLAVRRDRMWRDITTSLLARGTPDSFEKQCYFNVLRLCAATSHLTSDVHPPPTQEWAGSNHGRRDKRNEVRVQTQPRRTDDVAPAQHADGPLRATRPGPLRFTLNVVATSVADVVASVGGWLFDRRSAGWDVSVLVTEVADTRPLQILGVDVIDGQDGLSSALAPMAATGLALALERYSIDGSLRVGVLNAARSGVTEVAMWGDGAPTDVGDRVDSVVYRMSRAAEMFKGHALAAAGLPARQTGQIERLYRFGLRPTESDLIVIGE